MSEEIKNTELGEPLGVLFDSINYYKIEDLNKFIDELTPDQALYCVVQAAQTAYRKNIYNLSESELLSKSIRLLSTPTTSELPTE